jgi:chaperonin GroES
MSNIRPLGNRVLVKRNDAEEVSPGGIVIPGNAKEKQTIGVVIAVGPGRKIDGKREEMDLKAGEHVMFGKYTGTEVEDGGSTLLLMNETDILAVIDG